MLKLIMLIAHWDCFNSTLSCLWRVKGILEYLYMHSKKLLALMLLSTDLADRIGVDMLKQD